LKDKLPTGAPFVRPRKKRILIYRASAERTEKVKGQKAKKIMERKEGEWMHVDR
jgi:hypothetical protein